MATQRWYVYDIRTQLEDFVACFADIDEAREWGDSKFGEHAYVTQYASHGRTDRKGKPPRRCY